MNNQGMNERQLGELLLQLDAGGLRDEPDPRRYTEQILRRDRSRVWWLTAGTISLWSFAMLLVMGVMITLALLMPLKAHLRDQPERLNAEQRAAAERTVDEGMSMMLVLTTFSGGVTLAAMLLSLLLILSSRQATLRQVNANLLEISEQLRALRSPARPASA
jgi:hypothetical protein